MEKLFQEDTPIIDLFLCLDGQTLTYNRGQDVIARAPGAEPTNLGPGSSLRKLADGRFILCHDGALLTTDLAGKRTPVKAKGSLVKSLAKVYVQGCSPNAAGDSVACSIGGITRPNVWGMREYCSVVDLSASTVEVFDLETYGGQSSFSHADNLLILNCWEIKGGALYLLDLDGNILGNLIGFAPSLSPSGQMLAYRSESAIQVARFDGKEWISTDRFSQPEQGLHANYNPPVWFDDDVLAYDSSTVLYRFDLEKNNAKKILDLPDFSIRRTCTLVGSASRGLLAVQRENEGEALVAVPL